MNKLIMIGGKTCNIYCHTYACRPDMKNPYNPMTPRYCVEEYFFTKYSCPTFDVPYKTAAVNAIMSPTTSFGAVQKEII